MIFNRCSPVVSRSRRSSEIAASAIVVSVSSELTMLRRKSESCSPSRRTSARSTSTSSAASMSLRLVVVPRARRDLRPGQPRRPAPGRTAAGQRSAGLPLAAELERSEHEARDLPAGSSEFGVPHLGASDAVDIMSGAHENQCLLVGGKVASEVLDRVPQRPVRARRSVRREVGLGRASTGPEGEQSVRHQWASDIRNLLA
jgi:hypothetical protein